MHLTTIETMKCSSQRAKDILTMDLEHRFYNLYYVWLNLRHRSGARSIGESETRVGVEQVGWQSQGNIDGHMAISIWRY